MGAQMELSRGAYALGTGQRRPHDPVSMDVAIMPNEENWQRSKSNCAALRDVQIKSSTVECASSMEQRSNGAAAKGAQTKSRMEECALGMEQRSSDVALMVAILMPNVEECVGGTGQIAILDESTAFGYSRGSEIKKLQQLSPIDVLAQLQRVEIIK